CGRNNAGNFNPMPRTCCSQETRGRRLLYACWPSLARATRVRYRRSMPVAATSECSGCATWSEIYREPHVLNAAQCRPSRPGQGETTNPNERTGGNPKLCLSIDRRGQRLVIAVHDENREQLCWLGRARITADRMVGARRLIPAFARAVDSPGSVIHLRLDLPG